jgi:phage replication O-like protein O
MGCEEKVNPQTENGFTQIATEIVDAFCRYRLSGEEWLVLWVVIRKTYGWHKTEDCISLTQFSLMTGLKKQSVIRALNKLRDKNILLINKIDNGKLIKYRFNKYYNEWQPLTKKITTYIPKASLKRFCYLCNFKEALEEHHIIPRSKGGSNKIDNKIILCPNCHTLVHKGKHTEKFLINKKDNTENISNNDNGKLTKVLPTKESNTKEKKCITPFSQWGFDIVWSRYPKKLGRREAQRSFNKTVTDNETFNKILFAEKKFIEYHKEKGTLIKFIPYGSTWFNNWQDWVEYREGEKHARKTDRLI